MQFGDNADCQFFVGQQAVGGFDPNLVMSLLQTNPLQAQHTLVNMLAQVCGQVGLQLEAEHVADIQELVRQYLDIMRRAM